jgi:hypothetical protein
MQFSISLETTNEFDNPYYEFQTIGAWQEVWKILCDMAYFNHNADVEEIIVTSPYDEKEDARFYERNRGRIRNHGLLCFHHIWRQYDAYTPIINHNLKRIVVPRELFDALGMRSFMKEVFPQCKVVFWPE